jgi:hypothetical protein
MGAAGDNLTDRQEAAIVALLAEPTRAAAAAKAGVAESTLYRWLAEPAFRRAYRESRRAVVEAAIGRLQQAASAAVDALTKNLTCDNPAAVNTAAKAIVEHAIRGVELADLAERVEQLERQMAGGGGPDDGGTGGAAEEAGAGRPVPGGDPGPPAV